MSPLPTIRPELEGSWKIRLVPHVIAPMLLGSKGEKRRVTGQRWEEPDSQPSIPTSRQTYSKSGYVRVATTTSLNWAAIRFVGLA